MNKSLIVAALLLAAACGNAAELVDKDVSVYDGSMHVWTKDPNNPLARMKLPQFD